MRDGQNCAIIAKVTIRKYTARIVLWMANGWRRVLSTWQEPRTLSKNLTVQFEKVIYQIQTKRSTYAMRKAQVTVCKDACGNISLLYKQKPLPYTVFHKQEHQAEIVEAKDVNRVFQNQRSAHKPAPDHPWRKYPISDPISHPASQ